MLAGHRPHASQHYPPRLAIERGLAGSLARVFGFVLVILQAVKEPRLLFDEIDMLANVENSML